MATPPGTRPVPDCAAAHNCQRLPRPQPLPSHQMRRRRGKQRQNCCAAHNRPTPPPSRHPCHTFLPLPLPSHPLPSHQMRRRRGKWRQSSAMRLISECSCTSSPISLEACEGSGEGARHRVLCSPGRRLKRRDEAGRWLAPLRWGNAPELAPHAQQCSPTRHTQVGCKVHPCCTPAAQRPCPPQTRPAARGSYSAWSSPPPAVEGTQRAGK